MPLFLWSHKQQAKEIIKWGLTLQVQCIRLILSETTRFDLRSASSDCFQRGWGKISPHIMAKLSPSPHLFRKWNTELSVKFVPSMNISIDCFIYMVKILLAFSKLGQMSLIYCQDCIIVQLCCQLSYRLEIIFVLKQNKRVFFVWTALNWLNRFYGTV